MRAAATVPAASRGYDGGKKVPGPKRHIVTDTLGLLLAVAVTAANTGDREAATGSLGRLRRLHRDITLVWADGGYTGSLVDWSRGTLALTLEIVKRTDDMTEFLVLPRRWVAERTFAWLMNSRRPARDYETLANWPARSGWPRTPGSTPACPTHCARPSRRAGCCACRTPTRRAPPPTGAWNPRAPSAATHWYLIGWCRLRSAVRGFRLDRIRHVEVLAETVPPRVLNLAEVDTLGWEFVGLDELPNTDRGLSPKAWRLVQTDDRKA
ncbi:transposase [Streptomyces sp. NPDC004126]|uniref:transposase n=1 Tax=Streptomyces sp. NPDC004126 TaxID=3390695 RepID=UPI003D031953